MVLVVKKELQGTSLHTCPIILYILLKVNLIHFNQNTSLYKRLYKMKSAKVKYGAKSGRYQVHASKSPVPMELHRI